MVILIHDWQLDCLERHAAGGQSGPLRRVRWVPWGSPRIRADKPRPARSQAGS